jgi:hypothetical protein
MESIEDAFPQHVSGVIRVFKVTRCLVHLVLLQRGIVLLVSSAWVGRRHFSVFVENVQEIWVADNIIKARGEQAHELIQLTSRNALYILRDHIDEVVLLNYPNIIRVESSELAI